MDYNPQTENAIGTWGGTIPMCFIKENDMIICDDIWNDTWFVTIPQRQKLLYLYLLSKSSKCGIFELNMRTINFDLSCDGEKLKPYTVEEVLTFAGDRIRRINETKAIIVSYIQMNWVRGKPLDPTKNPLHRGLQQELARYGLTFDTINKLEPYHKPKVEVVQPDFGLVQEESNSVEDMFSEFWAAYPSECPRKVDKKKCLAKYKTILSAHPDIHSEIMYGLHQWKVCDTWTKDGGRYIKAPLVWLNGENWKDNPKKGTCNGNNNSTGVKVRENSFHGSAQNFKGLF